MNALDSKAHTAMSPAEWQEVKRLFEASLDTPPELRAKMLAEADVPEAIRAEAARLLENHKLARETFLNAPGIIQRLSEEQREPVASLSVGERLGPYDIIALIGAGGMGEVYKARDTRLNRSVALKVSKAEFSKRFEREARAVAALNHPHICQLHDVGPNYLVMEFVDGGPIVPTSDVATLLDQAMQMADGMMAAHAVGITHRDLKPGNILVTREGRVKILDFGLALVASSSETYDADATLTMDLTDQGTAIGTVPYMSPEQAKGLKVDARSDLWSLGVILYEMATRTRPFQGTTAAVVFKEILTKETAPVRERNPNIPPEFERIISRLLEKDRETRYQSAADVRADLKRVERASSSTGISTSPSKSSRWRRYALAAGALLLAIGGGAWLVKSRLNPAPPLTSKDIIVVADFDNRTGDPVFDVTLREALAAKLQQSELLLPMSTAGVRELLTEAKRDLNAPITADLANELCIRAGQKATLTGTISALGTNYVLLLKATSCQQGTVLASAQAEAQGKEKVMAALSTAVDGIREQLGETLALVDSPERPSAMPVTTASLEAYQAFALGLSQERLGQWGAAIPHFHRAREIDPNFAIAWHHEGEAYSTLGQGDVGLPLVRKAYELREHASPAERSLIEAVHYLDIGDLDKAGAAWEEALRLVPRSTAPMVTLANLYAFMGDFDRSLAMRKRELEADPFDAIVYGNLMVNYMRLDRFAEAKAVAEMPFAKKANPPSVHRQLLEIAYLEGDLAAAGKQLQILEQTSQHGLALGIRLRYLVGHGKFSEAEAEVPAIRALGLRTKSQTLGNNAIANIHVGKALAGDCGFLKKAQEATPGFPPSIDVPFFCEENEQVVTLGKKILALPNISPDNAILVRAQIALAQHQPQQAIDTLASVRRDNVSVAPHLRGKAYMELKKPAEAAAEFRKLIARELQSSDIVYPSAHVQLARALAQAGNTVEAKKTYEVFFNLWKDADPGIPLLDAARKEYAALR
jgi:eukaryotic-like serine/threonine-protein kinase